MDTISRLLLQVLVLVLLFSKTALLAHAESGPDEAAAPMKLLPAATGQRSVLIIDEAKRRRLNSFQICSLCTCCGGPRGLCLPSPCCYSINCNIPNRPFGFCSFTPKTCNCFGCHL